MSKATWGLIVSALFAVVTSITPIPEKWRPLILSVSWTAFLLACFGWIIAHFASSGKWKPTSSAAVLVVVGSLGAAAAIGIWLLNTSNQSTGQDRVLGQGDEVSKIESLLNGVQDTAYRQLVAAVIYAFDPHSSLSVGVLENTPDGTRTVDVEVRSVQDGKPTLTAIDVLNLPSGRKADRFFPCNPDALAAAAWNGNRS